MSLILMNIYYIKLARGLFGQQTCTHFGQLHPEFRDANLLIWKSKCVVYIIHIMVIINKYINLTLTKKMR